MLRRALISKLLQAQANRQIVEIDVGDDEYELSEILGVGTAGMVLRNGGECYFDDIKRIRFLKRGAWTVVEKRQGDTT